MTTWVKAGVEVFPGTTGARLLLYFHPDDLVWLSAHIWFHPNFNLARPTENVTQEAEKGLLAR